MASIIIDKTNKEIEIFEIDSKNLITLELGKFERYESTYISIDLTKEEALKVIEFLQAQIK